MSSGCSKGKPLKQKKRRSFTSGSIEDPHPCVPLSHLSTSIPSESSRKGIVWMVSYGTVPWERGRKRKRKGDDPRIPRSPPPPTLPSGSLRFLSSLPLLFLIETKGKETSDGNRIFSYGTRNESMGETVRGDVRTDAKSSKRRSVRRTNAQDERTFGTIAGRKENKI